MSGKRGRASLVLMVIFIVLATITLPGFLHYWYRAGAGHYIREQLKDVNIDGLSDAEHMAVRRSAQLEGIQCALLMLAGQHIPFFLLILITIGILSRTTRPKFRTSLKLAFPLVCLSAVIFLSFGTTYWGMAAPFPESLGPATFIWLLIAVFFGLIIGLFKLITVLSRPEEKPQDGQKQ